MDVGAHRLRGVAWSGAAPVAKVDISTDDGGAWQSASLQESGSRHAWRRWEYNWQATEPGRYLIRARATDESREIESSHPDISTLADPTALGPSLNGH